MKTSTQEYHNALLEFARAVKARKQVVAGTLHHLTVEAVEGGEKIGPLMFTIPCPHRPWQSMADACCCPPSHGCCSANLYMSLFCSCLMEMPQTLHLLLQVVTSISGSKHS
ncbi:hypothetical protein ZIOFF_043197 [Zingiber officinale]|uniref:Cystatin domain-containing protein n=1 Tax=Zingiber officinale TaxID=94328 RepID=A0A8J5G3Q0_ZINOF|nr:hypothetical protein ZIOFF_043197 [Zingiber officinale]